MVRKSHKGASLRAEDGVVSSRRSAESLLAPRLTPTIRPGPAAPRDARRHGVQPVAVEPVAVDDGPSSGRRKTRGRALPGCGFGVTPPISMKPKPSPSAPSIASPCLSKPPRARPDWRRPGRRRPSPAPDHPGRRQVRPMRQRRHRQPVRGLRVERLQEGPGQPEQGDLMPHPPERHARHRAERQRLRPAHIPHGERGVQMRKELAAARRLPAQRLAQPLGRDRDQQQPRTPREVPGGGLARLRSGRRNGCSRPQVDRRAGEAAGSLGPGPVLGRMDLVDQRHARPVPEKRVSARSPL